MYLVLFKLVYIFVLLRFCPQHYTVMRWEKNLTRAYTTQANINIFFNESVLSLNVYQDTLKTWLHLFLSTCYGLRHSHFLYLEKMKIRMTPPPPLFTLIIIAKCRGQECWLDLWTLVRARWPLERPQSLHTIADIPYNKDGNMDKSAANRRKVLHFREALHSSRGD